MSKKSAAATSIHDQGDFMHVRNFFSSRLILLLLAIAIFIPANASAVTGFVYVATNQASGNSVIQFVRNPDGSLTKLKEVSTGGLGGTGNGVGALDPLGSQDSLIVNDVGSLLLVVNAGSNELSSMRAGGAGLKLLSKVSSHGTFPNSVAIHQNLIYVLNGRGTPNISGYRISSTGVLQPISGSTRQLPGGSSSQPHDIQFTPDGTRLIVTEGGTNKIDIFELSNLGVPRGVVTQTSAGEGPFGFKFGRSGALFVTEATSNTLSSYSLTTADMLNVVSNAVPTTQMATCWISLTGTGKNAFVSNTGSGTLSSFVIDRDGTLHRANKAAATLPGGAPIDSSFTSDSAYFYVVDSAMGRVFWYRLNGADLQPIGVTSGLPKTVQGIAAQ